MLSQQSMSSLILPSFLCSSLIFFSLNSSVEENSRTRKESERFLKQAALLVWAVLQKKSGFFLWNKQFFFLSGSSETNHLNSSAEQQNSLLEQKNTSSLNSSAEQHGSFLKNRSENLLLWAVLQKRTIWILQQNSRTAFLNRRTPLLFWLFFWKHLGVFKKNEVFFCSDKKRSAVLLFCCSAVLLFYCSAVLLFCCSAVQTREEGFLSGSSETNHAVLLFRKKLLKQLSKNTFVYVFLKSWKHDGWKHDVTQAKKTVLYFIWLTFSLTW